MKKKLFLGVSAIALVAVASVGTTMAVLQHQTTVTENTMTVGRAHIEQLEYQRAVDNNGNFIPATNYNTTFGSDTYTPDKLEPFTQGKQIVPVTVSQMKWDDRKGSENSSGPQSHQQPWTEIGAPGSNQLFDAEIDNVIDKFVFVKNTGDVPVYFRTIIAVEDPAENVGEVSLSLNANYRYDWNQVEAGNQYNSDALGHTFDIIYVTIDGSRYKVYTATHTEALAAGETARPSLLQLYLTQNTTNEDMTRFGDTLDVLVMSQAVQVGAQEDKENGRSAAQVGLEEAFGQITEDTVVNLFKKTN